jgi:hypothetical protein
LIPGLAANMQTKARKRARRATNVAAAAGAVLYVLAEASGGDATGVAAVTRAPLRAILALAALCLPTAGCYWGFGAGPTYPSGPSPSSDGANALTEVGLVFDYRRVVRVMYARSFQQFGGAVYTAGGQSVVAPLENELEVQVTVHRLGEQVYLRALARGMLGSNVRVGPTDHEIDQPGHRALAGMLGASVLFAADHEGLGPTGLIVSAGVLVGRADTAVLGSSSFVAPMVLVGFDFFPPLSCTACCGTTAAPTTSRSAPRTDHGQHLRSAGCQARGGRAVGRAYIGAPWMTSVVGGESSWPARPARAQFCFRR